MTDSRLIVVSNRLPITIKRQEDGSWHYQHSSGGLVSALNGLKKMLDFLWVGWPGFDLGESEREGLRKELLSDHDCYPVFLSNELADLHYNGFSNSTLWPLFHYLPSGFEFDEGNWDGYYQANMAFAKTIKEIARDGDIIWIHDYHLMLLPSFLRDQLTHLKGIRIGFFLHIPFPSSEIYRALPVRKQLLQGVLKCNLVGFHTYDYVRHFISSCGRILALETRPTGVEYEGRFVQVGAFPIGIEPDKFISALDLPSVQDKISELLQKHGDKKILVGVERLDYIKGVTHKLKAFDIFMEKHPEFHKKVILIQVAVPTRSDVEEYRNLRTIVNEMVGQINGKYGSFDYTPVHYLYQSVSFEDLVALYRISNVCIVTSTRDGMNLVAFEYIATQINRDGVLILSEFAGAAQSMFGAMIVNPWNLNQVADAIHEALTFDPVVAASNQENLLKYVCKYTAPRWGTTFVEDLRHAPDYLPVDLSLNCNTQLFDLDSFKSALQLSDINRRLILVDIDTASYSHLESIKRISQDQRNICYIITTSCKEVCEELLPEYNIGFIAENRSHIRHPHGSPEWIHIGQDKEEFTSVRESVLSCVNMHCDHCPGSYVTSNDHIITWNYVNCDREYALWQLGEMQSTVERTCTTLTCSIIRRKDQVSIILNPVYLSTVLRRILADTKVPIDVILLLSDELTPSDIDTITKDEGCSIKYMAQIDPASKQATLAIASIL